jgi:hypothetical protein
MAHLKKQHEQILTQERIKNNQEMQLFQQQLMTKMTLQEQEFNNIKNQLQEQVMNSLMKLR